MKPGRERGAALAGAALFAATALLYAPLLSHGFVDYDDPANILRNPWLGRFDAAALSWPFRAVLGGHFQPLSWLSLSLDKALWGAHAGGFHLTSLLLHAASAAVLFVLLRGLLGAEHGTLPAAAAAALFAWHPLRVESVAWATERRDQLVLLFLLLSAEAYRAAVARDPARPRLRSALGWFGLALLSKVVAAVFPVLLFCLDLGALRRPLPWRRLAAEKLPFLALAAAAVVLGVRAQALSGAAAPPWVGALGDRLLVAEWTPGWTLWRTLWPRDLAPYLSPDYAFRSGLFLPVALLTAAAAAATVAAWRSGRAGAAALGAAFFAALAPALGLFRTGTQLCADRFTLLPAAVLSVGVAFVLRRSARGLTWAAFAAAAVLAGLSVRQQAVWRDAVAFWTRAVAVDPGPVAVTGAVAALDAAGRSAEADALRAKVRAEHPDSPAALAYAAEAVARSGDWAAAEALLSRAVAADPFAPALRIGHGVALYRLDRVPDALAEFEEAVRRGPEDAGAWHLRAAALARLGRLDEAEACARRALDLDGDRPDTRDLLARLRAARPAPPK